MKDIKVNDRLELDWDKNEYSLNKKDYTDKVEGDIMYIGPRNFVEKYDYCSITNDGTNTKVSIDSKVRQVRSADIGKTIMFKDELNTNAKDGAGGRIVDIDVTTNSFILDKIAGLYSNANANIIITKLDKMSCEVNVLDGKSINVEWQVVPRYL